jgi:alpha-glucoside transport system permease protein
MTAARPAKSTRTRNTNTIAVRRLLGRVWLHTALLALCALMVIPVVSLAVTSFRPLQDVIQSGWWHAFTTGNLTFENYLSAIDEADLGQAFLNSLIITVPANIALVSMSAIAAYAISKMQLIGRNFVLLGIISLLAIPPAVTLAPVVELFAWLDLTGMVSSVWIFQAGFTMPLGIFILVAFFDELPSDMLEAAYVDGATAPQVFLRVALPLATPGLISVLVLHFLFSWNDLLIPLLLLRPDSAPITVQIASLVQTTSSDKTTQLAAAAMVSLALPVILFYSLQRYFVTGLTGGAMKG